MVGGVLTIFVLGPMSPEFSFSLLSSTSVPHACGKTQNYISLRCYFSIHPTLFPSLVPFIRKQTNYSTLFYVTQTDDDHYPVISTFYYYAFYSHILKSSFPELIRSSPPKTKRPSFYLDPISDSVPSVHPPLPRPKPLPRIPEREGHNCKPCVFVFPPTTPTLLKYSYRNMAYMIFLFLLT